MRVLFVLIKLEKNGAVLNTLSIMRHLDPARFEPVLFLVQRANRDAYWEPLLAGLHVTHGVSQQVWTRRLHRVLPELCAAARGADVVVGALEASSTYLAILASKLTRKPSLGLVQNSLPSHLEYLSGTPHRQLMKRLYPGLTLAVGVSTGVQQELETLVPELQGRVRTSYNLIDTAQIRSASKGPLPGPLPPRPFILAAGRLSYQKGFDLLIRAYAALGTEAHDLVILGDGPQRAGLEQLTHSLGVTERVQFVPFQANPYVWMRRSTLFVASSRYEGFCRVIVEALAVGVPVVATDCPSGPAEVLKGGVYGTLVPPDDVEAMTSAIRNLLHDDARRKELRTLSSARALDFDVGAAKHSFEHAVLEAVETYRPGSPHPRS